MAMTPEEVDQYFPPPPFPFSLFYTFFGNQGLPKGKVEKEVGSGQVVRSGGIGRSGVSGTLCVETVGDSTRVGALSVNPAPTVSTHRGGAGTPQEPQPPPFLCTRSAPFFAVLSAEPCRLNTENIYKSLWRNANNWFFTKQNSNKTGCENAGFREMREPRKIPPAQRVWGVKNLALPVQNQGAPGEKGPVNADEPGGPEPIPLAINERAKARA